MEKINSKFFKICWVTRCLQFLVDPVRIYFLLPAFSFLHPCPRILQSHGPIKDRLVRREILCVDTNIQAARTDIVRQASRLPDTARPENE